MLTQKRVSTATKRMHLNVSKRRREIELLREQAARQNAFLAATSHDLRQPLHAIGLFISAISAELAKAQSIEEVRQRVGAVLGRLNRSMLGVDDQIQRLLDWSRLQTGAIEPRIADFPLRPLMESLEARFAPIANARGIGFHIAICRDAMVSTDTELLIEILMNLLSNAFRYTDRGSVLLSARKRQKHILLQVWDTGQGMQPYRAKDSLLEVATSTPQGLARGHLHSRATSLGLGLAIANKLAATLSCDIRYRSTEKVGSVFSLLVPSSGSQLRLPAGTLQSSPDFLGLKGQMVLVIDDELDILLATEAALRGLGMFVLVARNLDEAKRVVDAGERFPDLVITDHRVGTQRSEEIIQRMRTIIPTDFKVLVVTGDSDPEVLRTIREAGHEPLLKPVGLESLARGLTRKLSL
jgi:two-component system, sensor histidine kinase